MPGSADGGGLVTRKLRVAVVGAGWWATEFHIPALLTTPGVELVAVCDTDAAARARIADRLTDVLIYADLETALHNGGIDAAVVATPHSDHFHSANMLLAAGIHTFVEKPLALRAREAWTLARLAEGSGVVLSIGYTHQTLDTATRLRERIISGQLGSMELVTGVATNWLLPLLSGDSKQFFGSRKEPEYPNSQTYATPDAGGGQGWSQASHGIGMICYVTGLRPKEVTALMKTNTNGVDVADAIAFTAEDGMMVTMSSAGTVRHPDAHSQRYHYHGSDGLAVQDLRQGNVTFFGTTAGGAERLTESSAKIVRAHQPIHRFVRSVVLGEPNFSPPDAAVAAVAVLEAAHMSAASRRTVSVDALLKSAAGELSP